MEYTIEAQPSYSLLEVTLDSGEQIVAEAGAMTWMDANVHVETSVRGGLLSGIKRTLLSGESFLQNTYTARDGRATVGFGPGQPGDIHAYEMDGGELLLERGAYLVSTTGVETNADFQGLRGLFNEGLFVLRLSGSGLVFFNAPQLQTYPSPCPRGEGARTADWGQLRPKALPSGYTTSKVPLQPDRWVCSATLRSRGSKPRPFV